MKTKQKTLWALLVFALCAALLAALPFAASAADGDVEISEANFPDSNFRNYVATEFDDNDDGVLSAEEIAAVSTIAVVNNSISNLTGIEHFTALKILYCYANQLTELDLSNNTALTELYCRGNQLTSLDVSQNTALTTLSCYDNQLTSLDVSKNTALAELHCYNNPLTTLDISKNIALTSLVCSSNQLTSLDVSKNTALTALNCSKNQLISLDVSKNTALTSLVCTNNQLTSLDLSKNTALTNLHCYENQLTELDLSKNTALTELRCDKNQLTNLDVSNNTALTNLQCYENQLTSLDVSKNTALTLLECSSNQLTSLDVRNNTDLKSLYCQSNQLTSLDVSSCSELTYFYCRENQLTSLDVSNNTALKQLNCYGNQLTSLDLSNCLSVTYFGGSGQSASITVDRNVLSASLPAGVTAENVTSVSGATLNGDILENITGDSVTYTYATGNSDYSLSVTLSVTYTGQLVVNAEVSQVSVTLDGDIGVNFYWTLTDSVINDATAYFLVTLPNGETETITVANAGKGTPIGSSTEYYKITGYVAAKEMADDVVVELYAGGELIKSANCSVRGYAERAFTLAASDPAAVDAKLITMMKAMLNYGAASQTFFGYNTADLANSILDEGDKVVAPVDTSAITPVNGSGDIEGFIPVQFSCVLETTTTIRHYFKLAEGENIEAYEFLVNDALVTPTLTADGTMYYVDITGIAATSMEDTQTFTVRKNTENGMESETINATVYSYMRAVATHSTDENLKNAMNAMHAYGEAAKAFFAQ